MIQIGRKEVLFFEFSKWGLDTRGWAEATRDKYFRTVWIADRWLREHRGTTLPYASPKDLAAWLFSTTPDARSRNNRRAALVAFGAFLVSREIRETNPATGLPRIPEPRPIPKALTLEQARMVLQVAPTLGPMANAMIHVFLYGGLRLTECRFLKWSNVEDHGKDAWLRFVGKRQRERVLPMHPELRAVLKYWATLANSPEWVFPSTRRPGYPVCKATIQTLVREAGNMAGIERLHPHAFRHSAATFLLEATGGDLRTVQEFLGHSSPASTAIYAMVRPARLREAVEKVELLAR